MAITTVKGINDALPGQQGIWRKSMGGTSGVPWSSWLLAGSPGQGVAPSSGLGGDVPTKATTGTFNFVNPASGNTYLGRMVPTINMLSTIGAMVMVYDRLWHNSGISSTSTGAQTINSVALTRPDANGVNAEAWWEVYVVMGAGTPTVTLAYTDSNSNVRTDGSSGALATTLAVGRCGAFQLHAGDTGVKSIQTWTASATFTSGTIGLVIRRMVTCVSLYAPAQAQLDALALGLPRVYDDACLELLCFPVGGNTVETYATLSLIQG